MKKGRGFLCQGGPWAGRRLKLESDSTLDFSVASYNDGEVGRYERRGMFFVWIRRDE